MVLFNIKDKYQKVPFVNQNWRLRNQIFCVQCYLFVLASTFVIAQYFVNQHYLEVYFKFASITLFSKETLSQINNKIVLKRGLELQIEQALVYMETINKIQTLVYSAKNFQVEQLQQCLTQKVLRDRYVLDHSHCYGLYNGSMASVDEISWHEIKLLLNTSSLLSTFRALGNYHITQMGWTHKHPVQFFSMAQNVNLPPTFMPHLRNWFIDHIKHMQERPYVVNPPTLGFQQDIKVTLTKNITKTDSTYQGVIAKEINLSMQIYQASQQNITLYLLDENGLVVFSHLYLNSQIFFSIFDENITGFDRDDWVQIQLFAKTGKQDDNDCDRIDFLPSSTLCRRNSLLQQDLLLIIDRIEGFPYLILYYKNIAPFKELAEEQLQYFTKDLKQALVESYTIMFVVIPSLIIASYAATALIMNQMNFLIKFTCRRMVQRDLLFGARNRLRAHLISSSCVDSLIIAMEQLFDRILRADKAKNVHCQEIECIKYNEKSTFERKYIHLLNMNTKLSLSEKITTKRLFQYKAAKYKEWQFANLQLKSWLSFKNK